MPSLSTELLRPERNAVCRVRNPAKPKYIPIVTLLSHARRGDLVVLGIVVVSEFPPIALGKFTTTILVRNYYLLRIIDVLLGQA